MVGRCHHLLHVVLLVLVPLVVATLGQCWVIAAIPSTEVGSSFGLAAEFGLDHLLTDGVLGGDIQEFPHCARGLTAEHMDERLTGCIADEGVDHVSIGDVGELIALLREALDVLLRVSLALCLQLRRSHEFLS